MKRIYDKNEEKYESFFNRFASTTRSKEPTHSSSAQEELVQLQDLRYHSFASIYALFTSLYKFRQQASFIFFAQLFYISNSFGDFCKEQSIIRESLLELSDDLQKSSEKFKQLQTKSNAMLDNQNAFFLKALRISSQEPARIIPTDNLSEFKIEKSQVLFVKISKNWKKAFIQLKHGYLTTTWLNSKSAQLTGNPTSIQSLQACGKSQSIPILLAEVRTIGSSNDRKFCFELVTPQQSIYFQTETEEAMLDWINCIDSAKQDAIKFTSGSPCSLQLSNTSLLSQAGLQQTSIVTGERLDGEIAHATFSAALQKEIQINGIAYFTESRLIFFLGIQNSNGKLVVPLREIERVEMHNFNFYDLVQITTLDFTYNFKFFNQEGRIFYNVLKYLREHCSVQKTSAEIELKITEIMKSCGQEEAELIKESLDRGRHARSSQKNSSLNLYASNCNSVDFSEIPIQCGCSNHYETVMTDTVIRYGIDSIFDVWFGKENNFVHKFLLFRNCKDVSVGEWSVDTNNCRRAREINYIMPLDSAFAKQVRCKETMEIISEETGLRYVVEIRVKTFDVPYCEYFDTLIRYCLSGTMNNGRPITRILITASIAWYKWTALKSIIVKQTKENMKEIINSGIFYLIEDLKRKFPEFAATHTSSVYPSDSDFGCLIDSTGKSTDSKQSFLLDTQKHVFNHTIPFIRFWTKLNPIFTILIAVVLLTGIFISQLFTPTLKNKSYSVEYLENFSQDLFLYEKKFPLISEVKFNKGLNNELYDLLNAIKEQRRSIAKNFIKILKIERQVTELVYARNDFVLYEDGEKE